MLTIRAFIFLNVLLLSIFSEFCGQATGESAAADTDRTPAIVDSNSPTNKTPQQEEKQDKIVKLDTVDRKYLNCWSSGNGNFAYIKSDTIQTRNSYKPLSYKDVTNEAAIKDGVFILELLEVDESNELQKYVTFKMLPNDEMDGTNHDSHPYLENSRVTGLHSRWVRTKCSLAREFMKSSRSK